MNLLVIVPSRGRPASVARLWDAWQATAAPRTRHCAELLVCLDDDDPTADDYPVGPAYAIGPRDGFAPRLSAVAHAYASSGWDALASWGDDHVPVTRGWDAALCDALTELGTGFAYGNDLIQGERLPTACAMTSDVVRTLGWMTPPGFAHMYVDDVWRDLGRAIDRIRYLPDVVIEHLHPIARADVGPADQLVIDANTDEAIAADRARYEAWRRDDLPGCVDALRGLL